MRLNSYIVNYSNRVLVLLIVHLVVLTNVLLAQPKNKQLDRSRPDVSKSQSKETQPNPAPSSESTAPQTPETDEYKLVYQDKVKYHIEQDPYRDADFPELIVSSLGFLNFPISRAKGAPFIKIEAIGKTLEQIRSEVVSKLEGEYYQKATVSLQLTSKSEKLGQVLFTGPIIKGMIKLLPGEQKKLSEAIVERGYTEFARLKKVEVTRQVKGASKPRTIIVNIDAVLHKGRKDLDLILEDGDTVNVPEKGIVF